MTTIFRSLVDKDNDASNNSLYSVFKALNAQGIITAFFFLFFLLFVSFSPIVESLYK